MFFVSACAGVVLLAAGMSLAGAQEVELVRAGAGPLPSGVQADGVVMPDTSVGGALLNLASRAGVVFVGQVDKIERKGGVVEVRFAVEETVAGVVGSSYTLREWGGLWTGGRQRYFVGQRAMVFLRAPGVGLGGSEGLSSPVDGMDGVVPVVVQGANAGPLVDVRWLEARVQRAVGSKLAGEESGAITLASATALVRAGKVEQEPVRLPLPLPVRPKPIAVGGEGVLERVK
jgi:hypothetical protein